MIIYFSPKKFILLKKICFKFIIMKRIQITLCFLLLFSNIVLSQEKKYNVYSVAFYNLENLFDTTHDEGKNDYEYLPDGAEKWTNEKYTAKLKNMSTVISELSTDMLPMGVSVMGVSEVENDHVLNDLISQPALASRQLRYVHIEGPDRRGIDCAVLYNPYFFKVNSQKLVQYQSNDTAFKTRGFLVVRGELANEDLSVIVNHWPSRFASSPFRESAGRQVRAVKDSLLKVNPKMKIIIMGDMNDDPDDKSMSEALGAKREMKEVKEPTDLYNPWWNTLRSKGIGTLEYRGNWNLFDQIVVNGNLLGNDRSTLKFLKNEVFRRDYMFQTEGNYKGYPKRTAAGGVWLNGYSDHLPTIIYLIKEVNGK
jgi:endonuclease/exonuclease/phosphatase family metal-dependent hydrolase